MEGRHITELNIVSILNSINLHNRARSTECLSDHGDMVLLILIQGPAKKWELMLLSLGVDGSELGTDGEEFAPLARENVATP